MAGRRLAHLPWFLRGPRAASMWLVGVLIPIATAAGFIASYLGLYDWAVHHGWPPYLAPLFPLLIDLLIIAGEVVLFVAAIDGDTTRWVRGWAWAMTVGFTGLSVAGNVSHAATADVPTRVGWALPPVVLALALGFGLGILKRQAAKYRPPSGTVPSAAFTDAQTAALDALMRTTLAGNPLSQNQLIAQFRLTRSEATRVRQRVAGDGPSPSGGRDGDPPAPVPAVLNGDRP